MSKNKKLRSIPVKAALFLVLLASSLILSLSSCQKKLKINYGPFQAKQVILANLTPDNYLKVNISKSKQAEDYNPVEFLPDCKVDLYEDSVFKETLVFKLKDTLSGLGFYTSSFKLSAGKTYRIVSTHPELGVCEATEYLPPLPNIYSITLDTHADSLHPNATGSYTLTFKDSANASNYYFLATYYSIMRPELDSLGDTTYIRDYISGFPTYISGFPNPSGYWRVYFTDAGFDGQLKQLDVNFPSIYNTLYPEIDLVVEFSNTGLNYYNWYTAQIPLGQDFLNDGQLDRANLPGNIVNGFGHFTANSTVYTTIRIR